ncbi:MAG: aspartate/glutamate racemase family protein [Pseudomonadota bacterium]
MTRLLAVNPNTSRGVTEACVAALQQFAPAGVTVEGVTGQFGARIVTTEAENAIAAHAALDLVAAHREGYDGIILAISFDTGLLAISEVVDVPVAGITEGALRAAEAAGGAIGVVVFGAVSLPLYRRLIAGYGVAAHGYEVIDLDLGRVYRGSGPGSGDADAEVSAACARLAAAGAEAIVICGAAIAGIAGRVQPGLAVPLFDGTAGLQLCLNRIAAGDTGPARPVAAGATVGLSAELSALIAPP